MKTRNLITCFFRDQNDYISFLVGKQLRAIANEEATCMAQLEKIDAAHWLYTLHWLPTDKYIGDYVKPFRATEKNIYLFNTGCKILAERLTIYIETNDVRQVPAIPPAFGPLTHHLK